MIKHTILMITFNQEDLVDQALESLFSHEIFPYEVLISDDCSTDNTLSILRKYQYKYPSIITIYSQRKNLGIFGNLNFLLKCDVKGDIISFLAGDDFYKKGIFRAFNDLIYDYKLNPLAESFIIISNSIELYPDKKELVYDNYKFRKDDLFKLKLRYKLSFRDTGFSRKLFSELDLIREDLGLHADWLFILDQIVKSDSFYFINEAYPVYRISQGIISKTKLSLLQESRIKVIDEIRNTYNVRLSFRDHLYLLLLKHIELYNLTHKFSSLIYEFVFYIVNVLTLNLQYNSKSISKTVVLNFLGFIPRILKIKK